MLGMCGVKLQKYNDEYIWKCGEYQQIHEYTTVGNLPIYAVMQALVFIMKERGASQDTLFYLDDVLSVHESEIECQKSLEVILDTCEKAGFEVQPSKTVGPCKVIEFLGIVIDTIKSQLRISEERMNEIREDLEQWIDKSSCTKREILSIIGRLSFCARVVRDGNKFLRRLIQASKKVKNLHQKITLTNETKRDLRWWYKCVQDHNGIAFFPKSWTVESAEIIFTDASDLAMGIMYKNSWCIVQFAGKYEYMKHKSIAWRELCAVVLCIATFAEKLANKNVTMNIDNQAICHCVNSGKSKDPGIMALIRALYYYTSLSGIHYRALHLSSQDNSSADALSRIDLIKFFELNPYADVVMSKPVDIILDF